MNSILFYCIESVSEILCLFVKHIVACCYTVDIEDQIRQEAMMQIIVDELRDLEDIGFLIDVRNFHVFAI